MGKILSKTLSVTKSRLKWCAYFMSYPYYTIIQNISFFFFIGAFISMRRLPIKISKIDSLMSFGAILFAIGALVSTLGAGIKFDSNILTSSLQVLPNYLYWALILIFLGNTALKLFSLDKFYQFFFWGLISSILSFYLLNNILSIFPFYRTQSPNNFAFLLIIFTPVSTAYVQKKWNNTLKSLIFVIIVTLAGFLSGSRSGSILTFLGGILVITTNNWIKMAFVVFIAIFGYVTLPEITENPTVKQTIFKLNERTYELIYNTDNTLKTDRSYLTRLAMQEKGLNIFREHPISGVGIGNFHKIKGEIEYDFDGGELLENKDEFLNEGISAHNSYISFLSEGGLMLFIPFLFLLLYPTAYFIINFPRIKEHEKAIFISVIFMAIHSWFIVGMVNVFGWFILGIVNSYIIHKRVIQRT